MADPYYADDSVTLYAGDCLDVLRELPDAGVDSVVTDPPYGLEFMGRAWDSFGRGEATSAAVAGMARTGYTDGADRLERPSFMGGTNPRCRSCGKWQRGGNPCACDEPDFPNERRARSASFGEWCEQWAAECLRVLKPGGHLLAFGGTRTWHRLACAIEDAGFEVRDSIAWLTGSGFPKSLNASRALDDRRCQCQMGESDRGEQATEHDVSRLRGGDVPPSVSASRRQGSLLLAGLPESGAPLDGAEAVDGSDGAGESGVEGRRDVPTREGELRRTAVREVSRGSADDGPEGRVHHGTPARDGSPDRASAAADGGRESHQPRSPGQPSGEPRAVSVERGSQAWRGWPVCGRCGKPSVPDGLGTALKPAFEPVVVARKPLDGTVAANVLRHGTGALNIDATRIGTGDELRRAVGGWQSEYVGGEAKPINTFDLHPEGITGRWPANVVLDESQAAELDRQSGISRDGVAVKRNGVSSNGVTGWGSAPIGTPDAGGYGGEGGASRFFYVAKAPTAERPREDGIAHPTVKPLDLMRWLVRLVTPPGGVVLEPFAGSGTTAEACVIEGFRCIAIEREPDYLPLIVQRLTKPIQPTLFGGDVA